MFRALPHMVALVVKVKVAQSCSLFATPWTIQSRILQARILEWVAVAFSRGSSQPRDQTQVSRVVDGFFTTEPPGRLKNTEVGSLSLLQLIFPTQESNWSLFHRRRILYHWAIREAPLPKSVPPKEASCLVSYHRFLYLLWWISCRWQ